MLHSSCDVPKQVLRSTISSLFDCREEFLSNPDSDFTRVQKISFEQTMVFPMVGALKIPILNCLIFLVKKEFLSLLP